MITVTQIRNGERYFSRHLTSNDYYSEGESITGAWLGKGAERLGLQGEVTPEQYEALRCNRHPGSGDKLTPRAPKVAFHDVVISAPKAFSIVAMVGEDERLLQAFRESVEYTFGRLERMAAVRVRTGTNVKGEVARVTGIATAGVFVHDTSRLLDPQVHAHVLFPNSSYDVESGRWLALQPRQMMEATKDRIRDEFYRDLAIRVRKLGYDVLWRKDGFGIAGISEEWETRYSRRSAQRLEFEARYERLFGMPPSKQRIEQFIKEGKSAATTRFRAEFVERFGREASRSEERDFVRDYRSADMKRSSRAEVRALQQALLSDKERSALGATVSSARQRCEAKIEAQSIEIEQTQVTPAVASAKSENGVRDSQSKSRWQRSENDSRVGNLKGKAHKHHVSKAALSRSAGIRNLRRGQDIVAAMKGYPKALIAKQVRRQARQIGHGA